jgi:hypothetical protein
MTSWVEEEALLLLLSCFDSGFTAEGFDPLSFCSFFFCLFNSFFEIGTVVVEESVGLLSVVELMVLDDDDGGGGRQR